MMKYRLISVGFVLMLVFGFSCAKERRGDVGAAGVTGSSETRQEGALQKKCGGYGLIEECLDSKNCTLVRKSRNVRQKYICVPSRNKCEMGLDQDSETFGKQCRAKKGCTFVPGSCLCRCDRLDGKMPQCICRCGGGKPPLCKPG